jgi:Ca2+-binding RTX toxin-like protein
MPKPAWTSLVERRRTALEQVLQKTALRSLRAPVAVALAALTLSALASAGGKQELPCGAPIPDPVTIRGTPGDDRLTGTNGRDVIAGLGGNDTIDGGSGNDVLCGGGGNDLLDGGVGDDLVLGGGGDDQVEGGTGFDLVVFHGGPIAASLDTRTATGEGSDTLDAVEGLGGSPLGDVLTGDGSANFIAAGQGNDRIFGRGGPDELTGAGGNDTISGGSGDDVVFYDFSRAGVRANLAAGTIVGYGSDRVSGVENVDGSPFADVIVGSGTGNRLRGLGGNDTISGGAGPDRIEGNRGNDVLRGQAGRDRLDGGPGRDTGDGGPGSDRCANLERKLRCP